MSVDDDNSDGDKSVIIVLICHLCSVSFLSSYIPLSYITCLLVVSLPICGLLAWCFDLLYRRFGVVVVKQIGSLLPAITYLQDLSYTFLVRK